MGWERRGRRSGGDESFVREELGYEVALDGLSTNEGCYAGKVSVSEDSGHGHLGRRCVRFDSFAENKVARLEMCIAEFCGSPYS
jgi:hypothetical protein